MAAKVKGFQNSDAGDANSRARWFSSALSQAASANGPIGISGVLCPSDRQAGNWSSWRESLAGGWSALEETITTLSTRKADLLSLSFIPKRTCQWGERLIL